MADPKIKFDIAARAEGAAEVEALAKTLDRLGEAAGPELGAKAREAAEELRKLGSQQDAISRFGALKREVQDLGTQLGGTTGRVDALATELAQASAAARTMAEAQQREAQALASARGDLDAKKAALTALRAEYTGAARATDAYRTAAGQLKTDIDAAGATLRAKRDALKTASDATRTAQAAERGLATEYERTVTAAAAQSRALGTQRQALDQVRGSLRTAGVDTGNLANEQKRLQTAMQQQAAVGTRVVESYRAQGTAASASARQQVAANTSVRESLVGIGAQLGRLQALAGAVLGGQMLGGALGDITKASDEYRNLASRIELVTGKGPDLAAMFEGVFEVAQRTNTAVESTGDLFRRVAEAGKAIGVSTAESLRLTETINQAVQISGASAESSDAAVKQLVQGLQSGVLRGDEFNSVMEQAPRLAKALADGLGLTTGELRKQAEAGKLTADVVIGALRGQAQAVQTEFDKLPSTVGRAVTNLSTSWTKYVGEVDAANGISEKAAKAINLLASNLDVVGKALLIAGEAAAAYKAIDIAKSLLAGAAAARASTAAKAAETAATAASTAATIANTAATTTNTAAKTANAAASGAAAVAWGTAAGGLKVGYEAAEKTSGALSKVGAAAAGAAGMVGGVLRGALGLITSPAALITILFNFRELGTAIGEGAARLMGWGKVLEENEARMKADAEAARLAAQEAAALAQAKQKAADAAFGLTAEAQKLVGEFDEVVKKGSTAAEAVEKLTKSMNVTDVKGIQAAGAALDELARKGKVSAELVREAWAKALNGSDLMVFATNAKAAFDGSEQGARRLKAALDAVADESLRRAGSSMQELATGFSKASVSAMNDVETLAQTLVDLGQTGDEAGKLLAASFDKALSVANTEKAVKAVIEGMERLRKISPEVGRALEDSFDKARRKLDDLKPGISSLDEALRKFGIKGREELARTADEAKRSWLVIRDSAQTTLSQKQAAFKQYADAAIAANDGVVTSELKVQAEALKLEISMGRVGEATVRAMGEAAKSITDVGGLLSQIGTRAEDMVKAIPTALDKTPSKSIIGGTTYGADKFATLGGSDSGRFTAGTYLPPPDNSGNWTWVPELNKGNPYGGTWYPKDAMDGDYLVSSGSTKKAAGTPGVTAPLSTAADVAKAPTAPEKVIRIDFNAGGQNVRLTADSQSDADKLIEILQRAKAATGG